MLMGMKKDHSCISESTPALYDARCRVPLYSAHTETCSRPQETSRNQEKSIKWQIFRAYNRSGSNICGAALLLLLSRFSRVRLCATP